MKNRTEWFTFTGLAAVVAAGIYLLLRRGVHGQSVALACSLLFVLLLRAGMLAWNLRRQRRAIGRR
jgi:hypothetical protein